MKLVLSKNKAIDFRVSTLPTLHGEKIVMRILDPTSAMLGIEALGYEPDQRKAIEHAIERPYGMILVTGPTGSGKTVSLYTCLNILNKPGVNISTAEDPAEINLPGINQVNVNEKAGLTFAFALRAFLRQDPDVIMVGEIRDIETAEISIKAADRSPGAFDAAHQRRAEHFGAPAQHGRGGIQHCFVRHLDYRPASRPTPLHLQTADGHSTGCAARRRLHRRAARRQLATLRPGRLRSMQEQRLQGSRRHLPGHADLRGNLEDHHGNGNSIEIAEQADKEGVRDLRRSGLLKVMQGVTSLAEVLATTNE